MSKTEALRIQPGRVLDDQAAPWNRTRPPPVGLANVPWQPVISMKILVAGAPEALGRRLVTLLTAAGHEVTGLTRSPAKVSLLRSMGADSIVADALDFSAVINAVRQQKPEIVVHELTSIKKGDLRNFDRVLAATNRLRKEGTNHLLAATRAAGVRRFIAQSFAGKPYAREGAG